MSTSQKANPLKRELKYDKYTDTLNIDFELHGSWRTDAKDAIFQGIQKYLNTKRIVFEIHFEDHSTFTTNEQTTIRNRIEGISRNINLLEVGARQRKGLKDQIEQVEAIFHMPNFSTRQLKCGSGFGSLIPELVLKYTYKTDNYGTCYGCEADSEWVDIERYINDFAAEKKLPNDG
ncbi:hypothetical protein ACHAQE_009471 [Botrytis cinerea]